MPAQITLDLVEHGRSADGSAANHQASGPSCLQALCCSDCVDHIAVGDDRDVNGLDDVPNLLPVGLAGVPLAQRATMYTDALNALGLEALRDLERRVWPAAGAEPDLDGDWHLSDIEAGSHHLDDPVGISE